MTGRINRVSVGPEYQLVLVRCEYSDGSAVTLIAPTTSRNSGAIKEVLAVGQKVREVVHLFLARRLERQGGGHTARRRNAVERTVEVGREDDHAVAVPRPAAPDRRVAKRLRGATRGV